MEAEPGGRVRRGRPGRALGRPLLTPDRTGERHDRREAAATAARADTPDQAGTVGTLAVPESRPDHLCAGGGSAGTAYPMSRPTTALPLVAHGPTGAEWVCGGCDLDWPCPAWTTPPTDAARRAELLPEFVRLTRRAIRDLRGRPEGPEPPEIVRRFLWFLPLTEDEARAVARRLR